MRPVKPGDEQACKDGWVYGTNASSVADAGTDGTNESIGNSKAKQVGGKVSGGIKFKILGQEANIGGEGGGGVTWTDTTTVGINRTDSHAEATSKAARSGTAEECNKNHQAKVQQCGPERP
jgi:hypothetical protein